MLKYNIIFSCMKLLWVVLYRNRLPVTRWVTNTINDQFKCFFSLKKINVFVSTQLKWLYFLSENDSIFFSQCTERKNCVILSLKVEWLAELIFTQLFRSKWLNFLSRCTERKNWVILTSKVESLAELKFDPTF